MEKEKDSCYYGYPVIELPESLQSLQSLFNSDIPSKPAKPEKIEYHGWPLFDESIYLNKESK